MNIIEEKDTVKNSIEEEYDIDVTQSVHLL